MNSRCRYLNTVYPILFSCCTENLIERTENKQMCVGGRNTALVTSGAAAPWRSPQSFPWCISLWCSKAGLSVESHHRPFFYRKKPSLLLGGTPKAGSECIIGFTVFHLVLLPDFGEGFALIPEGCHCFHFSWVMDFPA